MRVLHFFKTYKTESFGGVQQFIWQLCTGSAKHGITAEVLALSHDTSVISLDGHMVHRAKLLGEIASTGFSLSVFSHFAKLASRADVIHYHFPWPLMDVVHFATRIKKPTIVTYHSDIVRQKQLLYFYNPLKYRFLSSVDSIVATSPNYRRTSPVLNRYADKVTIIPIGLDRSSYPNVNPEKLRYWRQRFSTPFFLFVGVIRYYKGLHLLLEAAKSVLAPIVIVGTGPMEKQLRAQAAAMGVENVHFLGNLSEADKVVLLSLSYAFVFPSHLRAEAFGISLVEASMFGKPMISAEIGTGTSFVNVHGETGLVIPPDDSAALSDAMQFFMSNPEAAACMGRSSAARYSSHFTADKMVSAYVDLYRRLVDTPSADGSLRDTGS